MSKKFDSYGRFRGIKVKVDPVTGEVNLRMPFSDLEEILNSAILYKYSQIEKYKKELSKKKKSPRYLAIEENLEYCEGFLKTLQGLSGWVKSFLTRPKPEPRTKEDRFKVVNEIRKERLFIDSLIVSVSLHYTKKMIQSIFRS